MTPSRIEPRIGLLVALLAGGALGCGDDDDGPAQDAGRDAGPVDAAASNDAATGGGGDAAPATDDAGRDSGTAATRAVTIRFRGRVGSSALECGMNYPHQGSTDATVTPIDFRFYVQDLELVTATGEVVPVEIDDRPPWQARGVMQGVALIDLEDATGSCSGTPETNDRITGHVPPGSYVGVRFANGVPEALNHADPTTLPPVLQVAALQWSWLSGYRFIKAEVAQVLGDDADAGAVPGYGLAHPGAAGCSGSPGAGGIHCSNQNRNAVRLAPFDPDADVIAADLGAIFGGSDLSVVSQCHGSGEACAPMFKRLGIDSTTGKALFNQQVYRTD